MSGIPTEDPNVIILTQGSNFTLYQDIKTSEKWVILGSCICCGQCEIGSDNPNIIWKGKPGEPNSEYDITFGKRKDIPVRPEIQQNCDKCSLWGVYV
jgi:hypothetical protein